MPFHFRLEPLITIRDNVLKEKQGELAKAFDARRIVEEKQAAIDSEIIQSKESSRQMIRNRVINVDYLLGVRRQEMFLLTERNDCDEKIKMIDEEIERRRQAVMEANKELKTIEKLKEKKRNSYNTEQAKEETAQLDEIANRVKN